MSRERGREREIVIENEVEIKIIERIIFRFVKLFGIRERFFERESLENEILF